MLDERPKGKFLRGCSIMELIRATIKLDDTQVVTLAAAILMAGMEPSAARHVTEDQAVRQAKSLLYAANKQSEDPLRNLKVRI